MLSTEQILRCLSDEVTPVRDTDARLLGCIPRIQDDNAVLVTGTNGQNFELCIATTVCVRVDPRTHDPTTLPGFVPLDMKNADIGAPLTPPAASEAGADPDLGQPL